MRVLITGAGLVGAQVARLEQEHGREPVLMDLDPDLQSLADVIDLDQCTVVRGSVDRLEEVQACIAEHDVGRIVHTAAHAGLTIGGHTSPLSTVRTNVMGAACVLEAARLAAVERVVLCSSSTVHTTLAGGDDRGETTREEAYPRPTSVYAATKQGAEDLGRAYHESFGLDVVVVRFPAVFGPSRDGGGGRASVLVESWIRAAAGGGPVELAAPTSDWVYSKDAAHGAHLACWTPDLRARTFHIGMGAPQSAHEFGAALRGIFDDVDVVLRDPMDRAAPRTDRGPAFALDVARAREHLGFEVRFPLAKALRDFADWVAAVDDPRRSHPSAALVEERR